MPRRMWTLHPGSLRQRTTRRRLEALSFHLKSCLTCFSMEGLVQVQDSMDAQVRFFFPDFSPLHAKVAYLVFTASFGPGGFQAHRPRARQARGAQNNDAQTSVSPLLQLLPMIVLFAISFLGSLPGLASIFTTPDPGYSFSPSKTYSAERLTTNYRIPYYVNPQEFQSHPIFESIPEKSRNSPQAGTNSYKLRTFEAGIERGFVSSLRSSCNREFESKERRMDQHRGIFGFLGDPDMMEKIRQEPMPSCQRLRDMGLLGS